MTEFTFTRRIAGKTFDPAGEFKAYLAARTWLEARGFSVGRQQAHAPTGFLFGSHDIQKWRNLSQQERDQLHGVIIGSSFRDGPVEAVLLHAPALPAAAVTAFLEEREPATDAIEQPARVAA